MHIIGGIYKGKQIPFTNSRYDNADITSQMVKEAVFDILSRRIRGSSFLDLFSCSGQIGFEALSRGASFVLMNERDQKRVSFIRKMKKELALGSECEVVSFDSERTLRLCASEQKRFDIIYLDPPYHKAHGTAPIYGELVERIDGLLLLNDDGCIVVQHFIHNNLPEEICSFVRTDSRRYGQNALTFYSKKDNLE
ncbi:MAG TPA: 16S rRNA (guanine(966)-N(2))-methyltransferase RsmD [Spirochaetota bacterium]